MLKNFFKDEEGSEAVQMAILLPIILLLVMFITDRFIQYEGLTTTTVASNEALRAAVVQTNKEDAKNIIKDTLENRFSEGGIGWCSGSDLNHCVNWKASNTTGSISSFKNNSNYQLAVQLDGEWEKGSYLTLGVRTHKASSIPSYSNFRRLLSGGPIYHTHTYVIKALVEGEN